MIGWEKTDDPEEVCSECLTLEATPGQFKMCPQCGLIVCPDCRAGHQCGDALPGGDPRKPYPGTT